MQTSSIIKRVEISSFEVDEAYFCIYNVDSMDMKV